MAIKWAEENAALLLTVQETERPLDWELRWTVQDSIDNHSFHIPIITRFSDGLALALAGHETEARALFDLVEQVALASLEHWQDRGSWLGFYERAADMIHLYFVHWLLHGEARPEYLRIGVEAQAEAIRRSLAEGIPPGAEGYETLTVLHLLLGDGKAASEAVLHASNRPMPLEVEALARGTPTRARTLALGARYLLDPAALPMERWRERIDKGVRRVMRENFIDTGNPDTTEVVSWLCLPGALFGQEGNAWDLLASIPRLLER